MMTTNNGVDIRALCLLSGGLDSQLAVCLLREQGVQVHALTFTHALCSGQAAATAAAQLNVPHTFHDLTGPLVRVLARTVQDKHAPGAPCVEFHREMLCYAREKMELEGFHFVATGGVLNQRQPAQSEEAFAQNDRESGCGDRVVRPLSAACLPPSLAERKGWIQRDQLPAIEGPGRKEQLALSERWGISRYDDSSTECCLLDEVFMRRVRDLCKHEGFNGAKTLQLLRLGRHFRLGRNVKLVLGRNEHENAAIEGMTELYDLLLKPEGVRGPTGILPYTATEDEVRQAAAICLRYTDAGAQQAVNVRVRSPREARTVSVTPAAPGASDGLRIDLVRQG